TAGTRRPAAGVTDSFSFAAFAGWGPANAGERWRTNANVANESVTPAPAGRHAFRKPPDFTFVDRKSCHGAGDSTPIRAPQGENGWPTLPFRVLPSASRPVPGSFPGPPRGPYVTSHARSQACHQWSRRCQVNAPWGRPDSQIRPARRGQRSGAAF